MFSLRTAEKKESVCERNLQMHHVHLVFSNYLLANYSISLCTAVDGDDDDGGGVVKMMMMMVVVVVVVKVEEV